MNLRLIYNYVFIMDDGLCLQVLSTPSEQAPNAKLIPIEEYNEAYLGKYFINSTWHEKVYNEVDENGNPVLESGFNFMPWSPNEAQHRHERAIV